MYYNCVTSVTFRSWLKPIQNSWNHTLQVTYSTYIHLDVYPGQKSQSWLNVFPFSHGNKFFICQSSMPWMTENCQYLCRGVMGSFKCRRTWWCRLYNKKKCHRHHSFKTPVCKVHFQAAFKVSPIMHCILGKS